ncbi:hypothetical protein TIFTF001_013442 [Ficus carica]|uniref:LRAT domain-containing protein n=1 Tax=Ficus carica TaxID=3494 RepID=A0AA88A1Z7_FICCA|nr:hypothetical protein TIFTF001_013442 [Ficus carica]
MGVLSNKVDKSMLKKGDHIYSYRKAHLYSNHGIYVEEDRVIHYMSSSKSEGGCTNCGYDSNKQRGVVKTCLDCFLKGHSLYRFEYQVSSAHYVAKRSATCYTGSCNKPNVVVQRATRMLNNNGGSNLNLFEKNSMCFAVLCKTGNPNSAQEVAAKSKVKMALGLLDDLWTLAALFGLIDPQLDDDQAAESDDVDESGDVGGEDDEDGDEDEDAGEDDVDEDAG